MMLTKKQFDILAWLAEQDHLTAADCPTFTAAELEALDAAGYTASGAITGAGLAALEPYRVRRAIFMAAGFGSRMLPITINTPKPLVRVRGKRMIDTALDAVLAAGIEEIYVIRGYLAEQFDQLLYKYPMIHFIENPLYDQSNNIGSLYCAGDLLRGAYLMEADLMVSNPSVVRRYQYQSNYLGIPVKETTDWSARTKDGIIETIAPGYATDCHLVIGISYWSEEDGARYARHIREVFEAPGGKQCFMSQVVYVHHPGEYRIAIRECSAEDIVEIDSFAELKEIDPVYDV
ncbi:MAG: phosphocholine cytidylyltransferase family protein [Clostridia bacterium]|nr:phosphocholine cytidylyltransferase family protein [Clostridia bacterium]